MTASQEESLRLPCPRCGEQVTAPLRRVSLRCSQGHAFEAALFSPASPIGRSRPAALVASAQTPCARHARNAAVAACERCGTFMCALCRVDLEGAPVCLPCFERAQAAQGMGESGTVLRDWNRLALNVGLVALFFFPFAPIGGPLAVVLGLRGWRQDRRTGEPLHPLLGMLGMICGVVAFAIGVLFFMAMFRNWETGRGGIRA